MAWPWLTVEEEVRLEETPWASLGEEAPRTAGVSLDDSWSPWLQQNDVGPGPFPPIPPSPPPPPPPIIPRPPGASHPRPVHDASSAPSFSPFHLLYPAGSPATSPIHSSPSSPGAFDLGLEPEARVAYYELLVAARATMDYISDGAGLVMDTYRTTASAVGTVYGAATSKTAQRTLLKTALFGILSAGLFGMACVGYLAFYHEYLPDQVFTVPVHLQYGYELNPYGVSSFADANFKDYQAYDISVTLNLPNSPTNLGRGNFMLALHLLDDSAAPGTAGGGGGGSTAERILSAATGGQPNLGPIPAPRSVLDGRKILYTSTRPAIVPYTDPLVSLAKRVLLLGYHIFVPASETTRLVVPMVERLEFRSGTPKAMMPTSLVLDVQAGQALQVYSVLVTVTARLGGLRWFMHTWWITSFLLGTGFFWLVEVFSLLSTALALRLVWGAVSGGEEAPPVVKMEPPRIKQEREGRGKMLEDIPMTFPTSSGQPPLRYDPPSSEYSGRVDADVPPPDVGVEADVEDEEGGDEEIGDDPQLRDSGIGTSYSERDGSGSLRRRTSRGKMSGS